MVLVSGCRGILCLPSLEVCLRGGGEVQGSRGGRIADKAVWGVGPAELQAEDAALSSNKAATKTWFAVGRIKIHEWLH
jgi:hypothetical protein